MESWLYKGYLLTVSGGYLNTGFLKRHHGATQRAGLPKRIDNHSNVVFDLWIEVISVAGRLAPAHRHWRNDDALLGLNLSRLAHDLGSFSVFEVRHHRCHLRNDGIVRVGEIDDSSIGIKQRVMARSQEAK